jgi:hypothetical protein
MPLETETREPTASEGLPTLVATNIHNCRSHSSTNSVSGNQRPLPESRQLLCTTSSSPPLHSSSPPLHSSSTPHHTKKTLPQARTEAPPLAFANSQCTHTLPSESMPSHPVKTKKQQPCHSLIISHR